MLTVFKKLSISSLNVKRNGEKLEQILIVLDDFANNKLFSKRKSSLVTIFTEGRHNNISIWLNAQKCSMLQPIVRDNSMYKFFFSSTVKERKKIIEENSNWLSDEEFAKLFDTVTKKKHDFLMIDLEKMVMRKNFGEIVSSKY